MRARLLAATAVAALAAVAMPAHAAAPKSTTLFFDNTGSCGTENPIYSLVTGGAGGSECSSVQVGAQGQGLLSTDDYASTGKKAVGYKLDATRKLTGTVYIANFPIIGGTPVETIPGQAGAKVTISINGVVVGTASGSGQITAPNSAYAIPVNLTIPKTLNLKVVKSVIASVEYTDASGITGVSYTGATASKLVIPSK